MTEPTRTRRAQGGRWIRWCQCAGMTLAFGVGPVHAQPLELVWPTPNTAWAEGQSPRAFLQQAGSGDPESGGFGGVRSGGAHFHEGIDIRAVKRDRRGEPLDSVFAALPGVVRHINPVAGDSGYGRYLVLEHPDVAPAIYTLYAHLARIAPDLKTGMRVNAGQTLGLMGHTSGGYVIPRDRAHLHFEIGLAVTSDFQGWYDRKRFGSRNTHGMWNGMNLLGVDPIDFFDAWRSHRFLSVQQYFAAMEPAVRLRIATYRTPDFVVRYPALLTKPAPGLVAGWEIRCNWTGIPFSWTPLTATEVVGLPAGQPRILEVNSALVGRQRSKSVAVQTRDGWKPGKDLAVVLEQLFAIRL